MAPSRGAATECCPYNRDRTPGELAHPPNSGTTPSLQNFLASLGEFSKLLGEMSKSIVGDPWWAEMTEGQKIDAVLTGHATLKQLSEGLLDGSNELRKACRELLAETNPSFENLPVDWQRQNRHKSSHASPKASPNGDLTKRRLKPRSSDSKQLPKQRFGLPEGFVPRLQRYGRSVLLELNIYRLPNGQEFIPAFPSGTLGTRHHLYALLTSEQYSKGKRGSVYIRTDGRIFDYSVDRADAAGDLFDTGYTIYDLERTGRYAPEPRRRKKTRKPKHRGAAAG